MIPTPKSKCFHCWRNYLPNQMAAHLEDCERQRQFMCPVANCGRRFESAHGVNIHAASTHTAKERGNRFHCQHDGCLYGSDDFNALQSHQRRHDVRRGGMRRSLSRDRSADRSRQSSVSRSEAGDQQQERQGRPRERVQPVQEIPRLGRSRQRERVQPVQVVHGHGQQQENNYHGPLTRARNRSAVRADSPPVDGQRQQVQEPVGNVFGGPQRQHDHGPSSQPNRQPEPVGNVFGKPQRQSQHGPSTQQIQPEPMVPVDQFQQMDEQHGTSSPKAPKSNPLPQQPRVDPTTGMAHFHLRLIDPEEARRRMAGQNARYDRFMLNMEAEYNQMKQLYADHGLGLPITVVTEMEKTLKAYFDKFMPHHSAAQAAAAQAHNDEDNQEEEVEEVQQEEEEAGQNNNDNDEAPNQTIEMEDDDDDEILMID